MLGKTTKPSEANDVSMGAGQTLRVKGNGDVSVYYAKPGSKSFANDQYKGDRLGCRGGINGTFTAAVAGTYYLRISTDSSGVTYTLTFSIE